MLTRKVKGRISFIVLLVILLSISIFFIINSLKENMLYFFTPTEVKQKEDIEFGKSIRIGGMVKKNSITTNSNEIKFVITDFKNEIIVTYSGSVPNLFLEEKGVVAEGSLRDKKFFVARRILAKHDENYMPPEIKKVLDNNAK
jgi:cytochrome c-type biogenesis protein CcmE|tara:strand:- start:4427 stop:4855 length:429 start_codon:yes stop_codon:yes gene_type:complete